MSRSAEEYINGLTAAIEELNAYLDEHPEVEIPDKSLDQLWEVMYRISGRARPVASWTPGAWTRYQAVNR